MDKIIQKIFLLLLIGGVVSSCTKEYTDIENNIVTPDLGDPIIQSVSNETWYVMGSAKENWVTLDNTPSPGETMATMLYGMAWKSIRFLRDGTVDMVFAPPFFPNTYIHGLGTWQVSKTEKTTIIMNVKTAISNATATVKVKNLESKDQVKVLELIIDFGNRVLTANFANASDALSPNQKEAIDYNWIETKEILKEPLNANDVMGSWASANFNYFMGKQIPDEEKYIIRTTYIEDLLSSTPAFLWGLEFNLQKDGKALLVYGKGTLVAEGRPEDQKVVSNATWEVKGNKIFVKSDEQFFTSVGYSLFGLDVYANNLEVIGYNNDSKMYIQKGCYYVIEIIKKETDGFWCRITTNDATYYAFLFKAETNLDNTVNIKEAF